VESALLAFRSSGIAPAFFLLGQPRTRVLRFSKKTKSKFEEKSVHHIRHREHREDRGEKPLVLS
jgi:hypothetical protein